jgi:hypothetical protein
MKLIDNITDNATQLLHITLDNGANVDLTLRFLPAIQRWAIDVASPLVNVNNIIITNHPNLLWPFANVGSFGIACLSSDDVEPFQYDDFSTTRSQLYILESADLINAREFIGAYPAI